MKQIKRANYNPIITFCLVLCFSIICPILVMAATKSDKEQDKPVFYPPLPDAPRIQYLTSFSTASDIKEKKKKSWLADFVLGEQSPEDLAGPEKPYGVTLSGHKIYVADVRGSGYAVFDLAKKDFYFVYGSGAGNMPTPVNVFITDDGEKYIADTVRNQVLVFDRKDNFLRALGKQDQFKPADIVVVGDRLYVSDAKNNMVQVLDKNTGSTLFTFGGGSKNKKDEADKKPASSGAEDRKESRLRDPNLEFKLVDMGVLFMPTGIAVGPEKNIYVTDTGHFRVVKYSPEGKYLMSFGRGVGVNPGNFARPKGIALDRAGRLYVVDTAFTNIQIFDKEGRLLMFFGGAGNQPGGLNLPAGIAISYEDNEYFKKYAAPGFKLEYVILVASQFGEHKINVYGFGRLEGAAYPEDE